MPKAPPSPLALSPQPDYSPAVDHLPSPEPTQSSFPSRFLPAPSFPRAKVFSGTPLLAPPAPTRPSFTSSSSSSQFRGSFSGGSDSDQRGNATADPSSGSGSGRENQSRQTPSPSLAPAAIPSRHGKCALCALVAQCRSRREVRELELSTWNRREIAERDVVWHDEGVTVYAAKGKERLTEDGKHLIMVINTHAESVNELGPVDIPLLSHVIETARNLLSQAMVPGTAMDVRIGFVGSVIRDPASPHTHLHAHAMLGHIDPTAPGSTFWRRNVIFAAANWWSIEDLRAEIREESSNNRVKSGYDNRAAAPIDQVPTAGATVGPANALEVRS